MAHHGSEQPESSELRQSMELAAQQQQLGATGETPLGRVDETDEGEILMGVSHDPNKLKVFLNFGKPVAWMGMTPEQARELGQSLIHESMAVRGITA